MSRDTIESTQGDRNARNFSILAQVVAWLVGVMLAYGALNTRLSVTETNVSAIQRDMQEIKSDVKSLLARPSK